MALIVRPCFLADLQKTGNRSSIYPNTDFLQRFWDPTLTDALRIFLKQAKSLTFNKDTKTKH